MKDLSNNFRRVAALHRGLAKEFEGIARSLPNSNPLPTFPELKVVTNQPINFPGGEAYRRLGLYGGVVLHQGKYRALMIAERSDGKRVLVETSSLVPSIGWEPVNVTSGVSNSNEFVSLQVLSGSLVSYGTSKEANKFSRRKHTKDPQGVWTLIDSSSIGPGSYELGDVLAAQENNLILKGDDWSDGNYRRRWFFGDKELTGVYWEDPSLVFIRKRETYGFSLLPLVSGKPKYIALQWIFEVTEYGSTKRQQYGPIYPVWATSENLINWKQPFGFRPVIPLKNWYNGMVVPFCNPIVVGDELLVYFAGHDYEHNQYNSTTSKMGVGLATMKVTKLTESIQ